MPTALTLRAGRHRWAVSLNDSATARELLAGLRFGYGGPLLAWGGMRYFSVGWKWGVELPALAVERGDLVYWDVGSSLCIFAGPTPLDHEAAPQFRAPGPVSRVGRVDGDLDALATLPPGTRVQLEPIQEPG